MRKVIVVFSLSFLFLGIVAVFWHEEWVYSLPTPVPVNYTPVATGSIIDLGARFQRSGRPLFLHFFNPDCPCSRFNVSHFKSLVRQYGKEVDFGIVVMNNKRYTANEIQDKFGLDLPVSFDSNIAVLCGVYSTPQAVIIGRGNALYYRGNYNKSRYCTDTKSNYAQIALEAFLHRSPPSVSDPFALTAYGCQLPKCTR